MNVHIELEGVAVTQSQMVLLILSLPVRQH